MFTVRKIHLQSYLYKDGRWTYHVPPGWAVIGENGLPIVWKNPKGAINCEVYLRKYIAQHVADNYNEKGFKFSEATLPSFPRKCRKEQ